MNKVAGIGATGQFIGQLAGQSVVVPNTISGALDESNRLLDTVGQRLDDLEGKIASLIGHLDPVLMPPPETRPIVARGDGSDMKAPPQSELQSRITNLIDRLHATDTQVINIGVVIDELDQRIDI